MMGLLCISMLPAAALTLLVLNLIKGDWDEVWLALPWAAVLNPVFAVIVFLMHRSKERDYSETKLYLILGYAAGVVLALWMHFGAGEGLGQLLHGPQHQQFK